jgi:hypothetical protein
MPVVLEGLWSHQRHETIRTYLPVNTDDLETIKEIQNMRR